jgi:anthranilate synthase component 1
MNIRSLEIWGIAFGEQTPPPFEVFSKLFKRHNTVYLLESMEGPEKLAQCSFIGFDPRLTVTVKNGLALIRNERTAEEEKLQVTDPLSPIQQILRNHSVRTNGFRLVGGAVGYISYDAVRNWERLPSETADDMGFPDVQMGIFDDGIVFDHRQNVAYYYSLGEDRYEEVAGLEAETSETEPFSPQKPTLNLTKEHFESAVERAKEYVRKGDIFQVVLSKRYDFHFDGDLLDFYRLLRGINPSPYMYFFKAGSRQIVGSSPEMLMRVENRKVETFPIAGTRPIAENPRENQHLAEELLADPKERAEHVMLVDLARNDIGKVAEYGSVHVPEFMQVQRYSHVQHIVSRVVGNLREGFESYDAFKAVFPAGTVSGAPKPRAMEIIEELEPARRGPYAGAVGYFSFNGNADFAITIRTLFADGGRGHVQAGAGIVADSVPEREWFETEQKAQALMNALKIAGGDKQ